MHLVVSRIPGPFRLFRLRLPFFFLPSLQVPGMFRICSSSYPMHGPVIYPAWIPFSRDRTRAPPPVPSRILRPGLKKRLSAGDA